MKPVIDVHFSYHHYKLLLFHLSFQDIWNTLKVVKSRTWHCTFVEINFEPNQIRKHYWPSVQLYCTTIYSLHKQTLRVCLSVRPSVQGTIECRSEPMEIERYNRDSIVLWITTLLHNAEIQHCCRKPCENIAVRAQYSKKTAPEQEWDGCVVCGGGRGMRRGALRVSRGASVSGVRPDYPLGLIPAILQFIRIPKRTLRDTNGFDCMKVHDS